MFSQLYEVGRFIYTGKLRLSASGLYCDLSQRSASFSFSPERHKLMIECWCS